MMRRTLSAAVVFAFTLGAIALFTPAPAVAAPSCIFCPAIAIECGSCYVLQPQTCHRCAYCKRIPGCQP